MASGAYKTVVYYQLFAAEGTRNRHQKGLSLFPAPDLLKYVPKDIMGPLARTKSANQNIFVLTDRYKKLPWAILVTTVTSMNATAFL